MDPRRSLTSVPSRDVPMVPPPVPSDPFATEEETGWYLLALRVLVERWWVIVSVLALAAVALGAYIVMVPETRLFEARAQVLVEHDASPPLEGTRPPTTVDPEGSYFETQYRLLRSRTLARRTLISLAAAKQAATPTATPATPTPATATSAAATSAAATSATAAQEPADGIPAGAVDAFLRGLAVAHIPDSRIVEIRFTSGDAAYAARAVNAHTASYLKQTVELAHAASAHASDWLLRQIEEQKARVATGDASLAQYQQAHGALEQQKTIGAQRLSELNAAVLRAREARLARETAYRQVAQAKEAGRPLRDLAALVATPLVQQLSVDLAGQQRREIELSAQYGPRHPERIKLQETMAFTEQRLDAEVTRALQTLASQAESARQDERAAADALAAQTTESSSVGRTAVNYDALKQEVDGDRALLTRLQQRARELRVSLEYEPASVRVIDPAEVPRSPLPDQKWRNVEMGAAGSIVLAVLLALGLHYLDQRVRSPEDVKNYLGLPCLGTVPKVRPTLGSALGLRPADGRPMDGRMMSLAPASADDSAVKRMALPRAFREAVRGLRTQLLCTPAGQASRIVLVASAGVDEGKTLVATHLAGSLARIGHRVLLIDFDLRQPSVHQTFGASVQPGLSELLSGVATAGESIRPTPLQNLWILPAGRPLSNPGDLLGSAAFRQLMKSVPGSFDRIILDSPPVMTCNDASVIAHEEAGVIFVVSADRTGRRMAQAALEQLEGVGARFVGAVLNRVAPEWGHRAYDRDEIDDDAYMDYASVPVPVVAVSTPGAGAGASASGEERPS